MLYLLGIILGLLNFIDCGIFGLGEIFFIFILFIMIPKKKQKKSYVIHFKNNFNTELKNIFIFIIFLCAYILYSNININFVLKSVIKWLTIFIEMYLIYKSLKNNPKTIELLITFILFSKLAEYHNFNSVYSLHYFFIIPVFNLLYIKNNSNRYKYLLYIVYLIYFLIGKSRSALILMILCIACEWMEYIYLNLKSGNLNKKIKSLAIIFIFMIGSFISFNYIESNISESTESNDERRILIQIVFEEIKDHPIIGVGPINFNNYAQNILGYRLRNEQLTPHNLYLEILCENGIIGLILFLNIIKIILKTIKSKQTDMSVKFAAIYVLAYYMFATFTGTNRIVFTILFSVIAYKYYETLKENGDEENICNCTNL